MRSRILLLLCTSLVAASCGDLGPEAPGPTAVIDLLKTIPPSPFAGELLPVELAVRVTDADGQPVPDVEVRFQVSGGGAVERDVVVTSAEGVASPGGWTLGPRPGIQSLTIQAGEQSRTVRLSARWRASDAAPSLPTRHLTGLRVHPTEEDRWFAMSIEEGLYLTEDGGATWTQPVWEPGLNDKGLLVDPGNPDTLFAGFRNQLRVSGDCGFSWTLRHTFDTGLYIRSLLLTRDGALLVGPQWPAGATPGIFRSEDRGESWTHHAYGTPEGQEMLTWVLHEDEAGAIWSGNEIADHPQPYRPPFLASVDGGRSWTDVTRRLPFTSSPWHVIDVGSAGGRLYALSEGAGFFGSADGGASWILLGTSFALSLWVDPVQTGRVFGGHFAPPFGDGAVLVSYDGGESFARAHTLPHNGGHFSLTSGGRRMLMASWGGGITALHTPEGGS